MGVITCFLIHGWESLWYKHVILLIKWYFSNYWITTRQRAVRLQTADGAAVSCRPAPVSREVSRHKSQLTLHSSPPVIGCILRRGYNREISKLGNVFRIFIFWLLAVTLHFSSTGILWLKYLLTKGNFTWKSKFWVLLMRTHIFKLNKRKLY